MQTKLLFYPSLMVIAIVFLAACAVPELETVESEQPTDAIQTKPVKTIESEQPTEIIPTLAIPTETLEKVESAAPEPGRETGFHAPDPGTWTFATFGGIDTLDPAWNYESNGGRIIENVYDRLVTYSGEDQNTLVPMLAIGWEIHDEGATYLFTIRDGVKFHQGQDLTPQDVAYSFQRGLLQGGSYSPQWLFTEAFFGTGIYDIAELASLEVLNDPQALQVTDPDQLLEICQRVTESIVADEQAGTVTFYLSQPWAPLLPTLAGSWGSITNKEWAIQNGAWDGDCATWQDYYGVTSENTPLRDVTNGTGPYMLDHWTPGEEIVLVANEDYWLTEPLWEGGPSGPPRLKQINIQVIDEWGPRFSMLQAGEADLVDTVDIPRDQIDPLVGEVCTFVDWGVYDCQPSQNPDQPLRLYKGPPWINRMDFLFLFEVNDEGGNPYLGSGKLDGDGIPPNFFSDIHVRKAFNYCFDWETYIEEAYQGEAVQNFGPINIGVFGYNENGPHYSYDPEKCQAEIELAWDGLLAQNGFRMQLFSCPNCLQADTFARILHANFAAIDPKYNIEIASMPMSNIGPEKWAYRLPIYTEAWVEDIHDPHNWVYPFSIGFAVDQRIPQEVIDEFQLMVDAGVAGRTPEERAEVYRAIQILDYEYAPAIHLVVGRRNIYVQRWVSDFVINPLLNRPFYLWAKE